MALYPDRMDLDVLLLAGQIAAANAGGAKLVVPPALAARRDAFVAQLASMGKHKENFFEQVIERHAGKRITTFCNLASLYDAAARAREAGRTHVFSADSLIVTGGA